MAGLTIGTQNTMVPGQTPVAITSSTGVKAQMMNSLSSDLTGAALNPPLSQADQAYGTPQPRISVPGHGLDACDSGGGYNKMSVSGGGSNTHAGASAVRSPPLQFGASTPVPVTATGAKVPLSELAVLSHLSTTPAYYITMPFATPMTHFNQTVERLVVAGKRPLHSNVTLPACATFNGKAYVPCRHCNVSSYTSMEVTYACYDMSTLCPTFVKATTSSTHQRTLRGSDAVSSAGDPNQGEGHADKAKVASSSPSSSLSLVEAGKVIDMDTLGIQFETDLFGGVDMRSRTGTVAGTGTESGTRRKRDHDSPHDQEQARARRMFQDMASQEFDEDWESLERKGLIDTHVLRALQAATTNTR